MIKVNGFVVKPTIFPDGTSQIWKLPPGLLENKIVTITWYFEAEREMLDLWSIRALFPSVNSIALHMPYMPYARQDKPVGNDVTFSLSVFASLINSLYFNLVSAVDVHNPVATKKIITNFVSYDVLTIQQNLVGVIQPDCIVYPDAGAYERYKAVSLGKKKITYNKYRHGGTGAINHHEIEVASTPVVNSLPKEGPKFLIIDDICDGGATFISIANDLNARFINPEISLFVTHGIFSKGLKPLNDVGIKVYTTNSLLKNVEGFNV